MKVALNLDWSTVCISCGKTRGNHAAAFCNHDDGAEVNTGAGVAGHQCELDGKARFTVDVPVPKVLEDFARAKLQYVDEVIEAQRRNVEAHTQTLQSFVRDRDELLKFVGGDPLSLLEVNFETKCAICGIRAGSHLTGDFNCTGPHAGSRFSVAVTATTPVPSALVQEAQRLRRDAEHLLAILRPDVKRLQDRVDVEEKTVSELSAFIAANEVKPSDGGTAV